MVSRLFVFASKCVSTVVFAQEGGKYRMMDIKEQLDDIIEVGVREITNSYIYESEYVCGWRNGFRKDVGMQPGPTATALCMTYLIFTNFFSEQIKIRDIINSLLYNQCKDSDGKKNGWEIISLKDNEQENTPSVDATANVLIVLNFLLSTGIINDEKIIEEIRNAREKGAEWLYAKLKNGKWGVHDRDSKRVFVVCNMLEALVSIKDNMDKEILAGIQFLLSAQKQNGGWGSARGTSNSDTIYHTAKVLYVLQKYNNVLSQEAKKKYKNGIIYLKKKIKKGPIHSVPYYIEEEIIDCEYNTKVFYHDSYSELLRFMFESQGKWKKTEILKVVYRFIFTHDVNGEVFFNVEDSDGERKKQIWLLLPVLFQCHKLVEYLEESSKMNFRGAFAYISLIEFVKRNWVIIEIIFALAMMWIIFYLGRSALITDILIPVLLIILENLVCCIVDI